MHNLETYICKIKAHQISFMKITNEFLKNNRTPSLQSERI